MANLDGNVVEETSMALVRLGELKTIVVGGDRTIFKPASKVGVRKRGDGCSCVCVRACVCVYVCVHACVWGADVLASC